MPSKQKVTYVCTACGAEYGKWQGRCTACGEWNTVEEQVQVRPRPAVLCAMRWCSA